VIEQIGHNGKEDTSTFVFHHMLGDRHGEVGFSNAASSVQKKPSLWILGKRPSDGVGLLDAVDVGIEGVEVVIVEDLEVRQFAEGLDPLSFTFLFAAIAGLDMPKFWVPEWHVVPDETRILAFGAFSRRLVGGGAGRVCTDRNRDVGQHVAYPFHSPVPLFRYDRDRWSPIAPRFAECSASSAGCS